MRLQKYIALCGKASRRAAEKMIADGRVRVNGEEIDFMGFDIDEAHDTVELDGEVITPEKKKYYIMLHKPKNYVTTVADDLGRNTVMELVRDIDARIYPVGRLDFDTTGLLIMTNDGAFANALTHPAHEVNKVYIARIDRAATPQECAAIERGVMLDDGKTSPAKAEIMRGTKFGNEIKITIHEGRNRQVRRMLEAVGLNVLSLKRIAVGTLSLGNLPVGKWRHLSEAEVNKLKGRKR